MTRMPASYVVTCEDQCLGASRSSLFPPICGYKIIQTKEVAVFVIACLPFRSMGKAELFMRNIMSEKKINHPQPCLDPGLCCLACDPEAVA